MTLPTQAQLLRIVADMTEEAERLRSIEAAAKDLCEWWDMANGRPKNGPYIEERMRKLDALLNPPQIEGNRFIYIENTNR